MHKIKFWISNRKYWRNSNNKEMLQLHLGKNKKSKRSKSMSPKRIWSTPIKWIKLQSKEKPERRQWKSKGDKWEAICRKKLDKSKTQSSWKPTESLINLRKNSRSLQRRRMSWSQQDRTPPIERTQPIDESLKLHNSSQRKFWSLKGHKQAQTWPKVLINHHHPSVM